MSRTPKPSTQLSDEQKILIVLSVLAGEITETEAARRHGISQPTVSKWKRMFIAGGREAMLEQRLPGTSTAEATVQLRIWQKGAEHIREVPS